AGGRKVRTHTTSRGGYFCQGDGKPSMRAPTSAPSFPGSRGRLGLSPLLEISRTTRKARHESRKIFAFRRKKKASDVFLNQSRKPTVGQESRRRRLRLQFRPGRGMDEEFTGRGYPRWNLDTWSRSFKRA